MTACIRFVSEINIIIFALLCLVECIEYASLAGITLLRSDKAIAVGYNQSSGIIWLIGGYTYKQQLVSFNPSELHSQSAFTDYGTNVLPYNAYFVNPGYEQIDDIVYMIHESGVRFSTFSTSTQQFTYNLNNIVIPTSVYPGSCLAHIDDYFIIPGGAGYDGQEQSVYDGISKVQIYSLQDASWILNVPEMPTIRSRHECIVHPNNKYLYVIGGDIGSAKVDTVIKLYVGDMDNIDAYNWTTLDDKLTAPKIQTRAVIHADNIYVIAGWSPPTKSATYHSIDIIYSNDSIAAYGNLAQKVYGPACIVVDNTLFAFGGTSGLLSDYIQFLRLSGWTPYPTDAPTSPSQAPSQTPSNNPSKSPSNNPSKSPIYFTFEPTLSYNGSASPSNVPTKSESAESPIYFISGSCAGLICIMIICVVACCVKKKQKQKILQYQTPISNPMVLLIGIGDFDEEAAYDAEFDGYVNNVDVDIDINNLRVLFRDNLKYKTFPEYDKYPNIYWKQQDLINLLTEKARIFEENVITEHDLDNNENNKFDSLLMVISSHGIDDNIITSDYKLISKDVFHRIFSSYHPKSRTVPRVIIYDCCDGGEEMKGIKNRKPRKNKLLYSGIDEKDNMERGKGYKIEDIAAQMIEDDESDGGQPQPLWQHGTANPDHKLVTIHAANTSFQSKMNSEVGSYLIHNFVNKMLIALEKEVNDKPFLHEMFDEIQNELSKTKQLPICTYNNNMRYIKFVPNDGNVHIGDNEVIGKRVSIQLTQQQKLNKIIKK